MHNDDIDLQTLTRGLVRGQGPFILSGTVRRNIDSFELVSNELIINILTKVRLWSSLQSWGGLDAQMKTQALSQGQQQLFCLARAMLRKGKILIMDEARSNVALETDGWIQEVTHLGVF
jgi:ATP-binding cassette subfamily C (CFTR/MRP) protein 1